MQTSHMQINKVCWCDENGVSVQNMSRNKGAYVRGHAQAHIILVYAADKQPQSWHNSKKHTLMRMHIITWQQHWRWRLGHRVPGWVFSSTFSLWMLPNSPLSFILFPPNSAKQSVCFLKECAHTFRGRMDGWMDGVKALPSLPNLGLVKPNSAAPAFPCRLAAFLN